MMLILRLICNLTTSLLFVTPPLLAQLGSSDDALPAKTCLTVLNSGESLNDSNRLCHTDGRSFLRLESGSLGFFKEKNSDQDTTSDSDKPKRYDAHWITTTGDAKNLYLLPDCNLVLTGGADNHLIWASYTQSETPTHCQLRFTADGSAAVIIDHLTNQIKWHSADVRSDLLSCSPYNEIEASVALFVQNESYTCAQVPSDTTHVDDSATVLSSKYNVKITGLGATLFGMLDTGIWIRCSDESEDLSGRYRGISGGIGVIGGYRTLRVSNSTRHCWIYGGIANLAAIDLSYVSVEIKKSYPLNVNK